MLNGTDTEKVMSPSAPTLDELARDPSRVANLSVDVLAALSAKCAAIQSALAAAQLALAADRESSLEGGEDRLLTVDDAARILAVPPEWLYRNGKRLGVAVKLRDGTLRFSNAAIQDAIRQHKMPLVPVRRKRASYATCNQDIAISR